MNDNLYALFFSHFPKDLTRCCIETHDGRYYSWEDIHLASAKIANSLQSLGLKKGDRILVQVEKSPEALLLYLASLRAGFVFIPLNTAYKNNEVEYFIKDAKPAVVVCSPNNEHWITPLCHSFECKFVFTLDAPENGNNRGSLLVHANTHSDQFKTAHSSQNDLAAIVYTSGTTGRSKGAMLSHGNLSSNAKTLKTVWAWNADDVLLHALPLFHVHGLFVASHGAFLNGTKMIFLPKFDTQQICQFLSRTTVMMGVPTYYVRLLQEPLFTKKICHLMRLFISGSAPLLEETFVQFKEKTGHEILERYGMSETTMLTSNPYTGKRKPGTVGKALPNVSIRIVNEDNSLCKINEIGNIGVKGPNVFQGYWQMREKTQEEMTEDNYFKTGDVGKIDAENYISIVGRSKDLIISGGYNVYPKELELIIDEMTEVEESAVIGLAHKDFGESVCAVVVLRKKKAVSEVEIIDRLKTQIANFKVPKKVFFISELPRNAMGKLQKQVLREKYITQS
jgi:malonyl-CoA/methylmalonyl-CoA synthetase